VSGAQATRGLARGARRDGSRCAADLTEVMRPNVQARMRLAGMTIRGKVTPGLGFPDRNTHPVRVCHAALHFKLFALHKIDII